MISYYQTDPGKVRSHNEDSVNIIENGNGEYLIVVADGMGGHKAGEVASSLAVNELSKRFSELSSVGTKEEAVVWLKEIIEEVNFKILKYAQEHIDYLNNIQGRTYSRALSLEQQQKSLRKSHDFVTSK